MLLGACAGMQEPGLSRQPRDLAAFTFEGRISVRHDDKSYHANISWRHEAAADEIFLTSPLGQGLADLVRDASGARLIMADRRELAAPDWETLSAEVFGFRLPLANLPRWVIGHPPGLAAGWTAEMLDYAGPEADALPVLMEFRRENIEVRLKIDTWESFR